mgnify:CR=1 FL=1
MAHQLSQVRWLEAAIDAWEWVDAEEAQAAEGGPEPFPLTYTGDDCRLRWTHDSAGLMVVITRPFAEVAILRERLWSAEQELLAGLASGVAVAFPAALPALDAALLAPPPQAERTAAKLAAINVILMNFIVFPLGGL